LCASCVPTPPISPNHGRPLRIDQRAKRAPSRPSARRVPRERDVDRDAPVGRRQRPRSGADQRPQGAGSGVRPSATLRRQGGMDPSARSRSQTIRAASFPDSSATRSNARRIRPSSRPRETSSEAGRHSRSRRRRHDSTARRRRPAAPSSTRTERGIGRTRRGRESDPASARARDTRLHEACNGHSDSYVRAVR